MNTEDSANEIRPLFFNYGLLMRKDCSREGRGTKTRRKTGRCSQGFQQIITYLQYKGHYYSSMPGSIKSLLTCWERDELVPKRLTDWMMESKIKWAQSSCCGCSFPDLRISTVLHLLKTYIFGQWADKTKSLMISPLVLENSAKSFIVLPFHKTLEMNENHGCSPKQKN